MKKLILILIPLVAASLLSAISFEFDGENRTRAAYYNNVYEIDGGHVDNRLYLGVNASLHPELDMRINLQFGDVLWGGSSHPYFNNGSHGGLTAAVDVKAYELYIDYRIKAIAANIRVGQQYWADHMSLVLDDSFSGIMFTLDDLAGFKTELGWVKVWENSVFQADDYDYFLLNLSTQDPVSWGIFASLGDHRRDEYTTFTLKPFVSLGTGSLHLDTSVFMGLHGGHDSLDAGFGAAVKAKLGLGSVDLGADVLAASKHGIEILSPYYQNGLYIYGYGKYHDGVNLYWDNPYSLNEDLALSLVGSAQASLSPKFTLFGTAGYLLDAGFEANGGLEYEIISGMMKLAGYAALGLHDEIGMGTKGEGPTNYVLGTTLLLNF
ncbi:MAG: hypothetical protein K0B87_07220 [Candidatus Syntrophosphaera sp.]|nr:hypothetical protein [Candidatus Syntrophosphaera sp.]